MSETSKHSSGSGLTRLDLAGAVIAISVILLIGTEIWAATISAIWAFGELVHFGLAGDAVFAVLLVPVAVWATWKTVTLAIRNSVQADDAIAGE